MSNGQITHAFLYIVSACGREERFYCKIQPGSAECVGRQLIAWTPGAVIPMVLSGDDHPCLLDPLLEYVEQHGMPVGAPATGD